MKKKKTELSLEERQVAALEQIAVSIWTVVTIWIVGGVLGAFLVVKELL